MVLEVYLGAGVALNFCSVLRYDIAMCRRIIEARILKETFPRVLVGLFGIKTLLDLPIVSDKNYLDIMVLIYSI